ncbi:hypothetical protein DL96DRAFT_1561151 [Flagelloscypha sp. PMI_526]|nr:hypothetical protein DL96DRAFT_1561151 [Flagelloscypha sp. PMI_526]
MALNSPQQSDDEQDADYWFDDRLKVFKGEEGSSAQHPILIAGETTEAFTMLLQWVYKRWIEGLRIAHKFRIVSLTKAAMEFLSKSPMSPYERIRLCDAFHLDWNWAREAIAELCNQLESLPPRTHGQQQIPFWLRMEILEVREILWKRNLGRNDFEVYCVECGIMRRLYGDQRAYCKHGKITLMQKMDMALVDKILETRK